ncbi:putative Fungal-specific transcription factor domain-containing protein [Seiridium unicorne]|uniref:Fungal-specific transcription factor domain-containing protein n=1 Tax=Seiridium unicorne TaxID=138068 RepID=A0ABR2UZ72_9PEZI
MSTSYSFLESILVASSAMHYSNLMRRTSHDWPGSSKAAVDALVEALHARHDAIKGVQTVLARHKASANNTRASDEKDALLATILFFINFALIDSGKGGWRAHMRAARNLIAAQASNFVILTNKIQEDADAEHSVLAISSLHIRRTAISRDLQQNTSLIRPQNPIGIRDYIASDSVAYYIWGTTLDALSNSAAGTPGTSIVDSDEIRYIIDRTEANSYHSCPAQLLLLILRISRLAQRISVIGNAPVADPEMSLFVDYLEEAQNFNPAEWAIRVSTANAYVREVDELEIKMRTYIAAAYRASVCLYVLLAAPGLQQYMERHSSVPGDTMNLSTLPTTEDLTKEILSQLMLIPSTYPLFKYTTWPVFMTGVEAVAPERRSWIIQRLSAMWELCPWGMMKSAMETLTEIWQLRDGLSVSTSDDDAIAGGSIADMTDRNWLIHLRNMGSNLLIV